MHLRINDEDLMKRIRINDMTLGERLAIPHIDTFVFVEDLVTADAYKGKGLFTLTFDKALSMIRKRTMRSAEDVMEVCISMSAFTAIRDSDRATVHHVANLPFYYDVLKKRFGDKIIYRDRDKLTSERDYSLDARNISEYLMDGILSEEKISAQIAVEIPAAKKRSAIIAETDEKEKGRGVGAYISAVRHR